MSRLYINGVLTSNQKAVFGKPGILKEIGVMAGGTVLSLQLKHRKFYDFDIFTPKNISPNLSWEIKKIFGKKNKSSSRFRN